MALGKTNLTKIKAKSGKKITLTWKKVSKAEGYLIYRQDSSDSKFYQIGTVKSGSTLTYTDTVKSNNKTYTYRLTIQTMADRVSVHIPPQNLQRHLQKQKLRESHPRMRKY